MERRLAAVMSADAVGYTRMMARDDVATVRIMEAYRSLMGGLVRQHGGRVVDAVGDNLLAEFPSAVDAVQCAVEIQRQVAEYNAERPDDENLRLRIGVNVGDLVVHGDRIAGDGVNVAARLEAKASPGAVAISHAVLEQVEGKLPLSFKDHGKLDLKNVPRPVHMYEVEDSPPGTDDKTAERHPDPHVPGFGGRSAIAVLPFRNLSGNPEQEYFADGLAEDLIASLAALRIYPIISRNSSFSFKNAEDPRSAGRELGAHYIVTGSVRRAGDRVRVTAELEDTANGQQVWTGRYDRELSDLFEVQDEITAAIAGAVGPALFQSEMLHAIRRSPDSLDAWDCVHRGMWYLYRHNPDGMVKARAWAERALELQGDLPVAFCLIAFSRMYEVIYQWTDARDEAATEAMRAAEHAVALDAEHPMALTALGFAASMLGERDRAISVLERAVQANPSSALALWSLGATMNTAGHPEDAIALVEKAIRLSPQDPLMNEFLFTIGSAHFAAGRYAEAVTSARRSLDLKAEQPGAWRVLAAAYAFLERPAEAAQAARELQRLAPSLNEDALRTILHKPVADRYLEGLRLAGWAG